VLVVDAKFDGVLSNNIEDYPEGIVIVADKPYRWTSADVIRKIKFAAIRHFGKKNLKVGHAGTLDPLATGVLVVCIGNACKKAMALQASDKEYLAEMCFGVTTPSFDLEKDVDMKYSVEFVCRERLESILPSFTGQQDQVAPLFSAKQVDGVRAYELARKMLRNGESLGDAARELLQVSHINISELELLDFGETSAPDVVSPVEGASSRINVAAVPAGLPLALLRVACSKGTYIRALARDLGEELGSGATLTNLRRTRSGALSCPASVESILRLFAK